MARKLSDQMRKEAGALGKWDTWPTSVHLLQRAADELDRRDATIKRLSPKEPKNG